MRQSYPVHVASGASQLFFTCMLPLYITCRKLIIVQCAQLLLPRDPVFSSRGEINKESTMYYYFLCLAGIGLDSMSSGAVWRWCSITFCFSSCKLSGMEQYVLSSLLKYILWMLSAPCSPRKPHPTLHFLINGTICSSRKCIFGNTVACWNKALQVSMKHEVLNALTYKSRSGWKLRQIFELHIMLFFEYTRS